MQGSVIHETVFQAQGGILQTFPIKIRSFLNPLIFFCFYIPKAGPKWHICDYKQIKSKAGFIVSFCLHQQTPVKFEINNEQLELFKLVKIFWNQILSFQSRHTAFCVDGVKIDAACLVGCSDIDRDFLWRHHLTTLSHNGYTNLKNDKPQSFGEKLLYSKMKSMKQMKCNNLNRKLEHDKNDRWV